EAFVFSLPDSSPSSSSALFSLSSVVAFASSSPEIDLPHRH
ncbi:hypothetical protein SOVF_113920, partial [Spinacia oleracea]